VTAEHDTEVSIHLHTELIILDASVSSFESNVAFASIEDLEYELFVLDDFVLVEHFEKRNREETFFNLLCVLYEDQLRVQVVEETVHQIRRRRSQN
jgi:hypothetical protein